MILRSVYQQLKDHCLLRKDVPIKTSPIDTLDNRSSMIKKHDCFEREKSIIGTEINQHWRGLGNWIAPSRSRTTRRGKIALSTKTTICLYSVLLISSHFWSALDVLSGISAALHRTHLHTHTQYAYIPVQTFKPRLKIAANEPFHHNATPTVVHCTAIK